MTFLESAALLIPALTGVAITTDDGNSDTLNNFEQQYCFSPQLQPFYTAAGLASFFENHSDSMVYEVMEPLGSWTITFRAQKRWVLIGPYVEDGWNERSARSLLAELGASETMYAPFKTYRCKLPIARREQVLRAALLTARHAAEESVPRQVRTIRAQTKRGDGALAYPSDYEDSAIVNRRYAMEDRFVAAVSVGDREGAVNALKAMFQVSSDLRFISDRLQDHIAGAAALRTMLRVAAKQAGLSPVRIDAISQEYAQKMQHAASKAELNGYMANAVDRFCAEIRELRRTNYSQCVRLAMDYIQSNLSRRIPIEEVARAARVNRHQLTGAFAREVGMTIKEYLARRRCEIAAELLTGSGASVQEIAAFVGYPDNNYFTKVFKSVYGVPPQRYRSGTGKS